MENGRWKMEKAVGNEGFSIFHLPFTIAGWLFSVLRDCQVDDFDTGLVGLFSGDGPTLAERRPILVMLGQRRVSTRLITNSGTETFQLGN
jgi:hypothetical protein